MWGREGKEMGQRQTWAEMDGREGHSKQLAWGKAEELATPSSGSSQGPMRCQGESPA